jgi:hypothetical protein
VVEVMALTIENIEVGVEFKFPQDWFKPPFTEFVLVSKEELPNGDWKIVFDPLVKSGVSNIEATIEKDTSFELLEPFWLNNEYFKQINSVIDKWIGKKKVIIDFTEDVVWDKKSIVITLSGSERMLDRWSHGLMVAITQKTDCMVFPSSMGDKIYIPMKNFERFRAESDDYDKTYGEKQGAIRRRLKNKIMGQAIVGTKKGQWSARKSQELKRQYEEACEKKGLNAYKGKKTEKQKDLSKWSKQDWTTKSGKPSSKTGERYLPAKAIKALTDKEYKKTSDKKRKDSKKGKQFSDQPKDIAKKVAKYRSETFESERKVKKNKWLQAIYDAIYDENDPSYKSMYQQYGQYGYPITTNSWLIEISMTQKALANGKKPPTKRQVKNGMLKSINEASGKKWIAQGRKEYGTRTVLYEYDGKRFFVEYTVQKPHSRGAKEPYAIEIKGVEYFENPLIGGGKELLDERLSMMENHMKKLPDWDSFGAETFESEDNTFNWGESALKEHFSFVLFTPKRNRQMPTHIIYRDNSTHIPKKTICGIYVKGKNTDWNVGWPSNLPLSPEHKSGGCKDCYEIVSNMLNKKSAETFDAPMKGAQPPRRSQDDGGVYLTREHTKAIKTALESQFPDTNWKVKKQGNSAVQFFGYSSPNENDSKRLEIDNIILKAIKNIENDDYGWEEGDDLGITIYDESTFMRFYEAESTKPHSVTISRSSNSEKKLMAVFEDSEGKKIKTTHFGQRGASDYTKHGEKERMERYLERHGGGFETSTKEDWKDPTTAGALSRWILWHKPSLKASFDDYKSRFGLKGSLNVSKSAEEKRQLISELVCFKCGVKDELANYNWNENAKGCCGMGVREKRYYANKSAEERKCKVCEKPATTIVQEGSFCFSCLPINLGAENESKFPTFQFAGSVLLVSLLPLFLDNKKDKV